MPKNFQISQYEEPLAEDGALDDRPAGRLAAHRHPAPAPRGGRRQAGARGRLRRRAVEPRRLQPLGGAADGDREPTPICARPRRPPRICGPSAPCCSTWASATATWRRARCAATPTSRCGPAGPTTLGTKVEIKNLNSFRNVQRALEFEVGPAGAGPGRRRADRAGDAAVRCRPRRHALDALEGVRARLPLFPRARPGAAAARGRLGGGDSRRACRSCRGRGASGS